MSFMDKFSDIFRERPDDDFDDFYEDESSDFSAPAAPDTRDTAPREKRTR